MPGAALAKGQTVLHPEPFGLATGQVALRQEHALRTGRQQRRRDVSGFD